MACCLFGANPSSEPMLDYYFWEQISVKFKPKYADVHLRDVIWKCRLQNGGHFVSASMLFIVVGLHVIKCSLSYVIIWSKHLDRDKMAAFFADEICNCI